MQLNYETRAKTICGPYRHCLCSVPVFPFSHMNSLPPIGSAHIFLLLRSECAVKEFAEHESRILGTLPKRRVAWWYKRSMSTSRTRPDWELAAQDLFLESKQASVEDGGPPTFFNDRKDVLHHGQTLVPRIFKLSTCENVSVEIMTFNRQVVIYSYRCERYRVWN